MDTIGESRTAATSKMEHLVIIVNGWKPLTILTKSSILDVAAALDPPLDTFGILWKLWFYERVFLEANVIETNTIVWTL